MLQQRTVLRQCIITDWTVKLYSIFWPSIQCLGNVRLRQAAVCAWMWDPQRASPVRSGFPTHHADGLSVRVAVQFQFLVVSLTFPVHFYGFCGCRGPTRLQVVEVAQFIHQVLYQVVLGETHFYEHLQKRTPFHVRRRKVLVLHWENARAAISILWFNKRGRSNVNHT